MSGALARNSAWSAVAGLATMLGGFLSSVLVARMLGVDGAGVVAFAVWAITFSVMLADLGTPGTLARYLPELEARGERDQGLVRHLFRIALAASLAIASGFLVYALWLRVGGVATAPGYDPLFWTIVGGACLAQALGGYANGYLKGRQHFGTMARLAVLSALLQIGATYAGAVALGPNGAVLGAVAAGIPAMLMLPRALRARGTVTPELKQRVNRFMWESWAGYLVTAFAWSRMEIFFLERSFGSASVALFAVSLTLANLATQGPLLLTGSLLPYFSQHFGARTLDQAREAYASGMRLLALLIFPACLGTAAITPVLVPAIYGPDFGGAVPSAALLVGGAALSATSSIAFTYLLAMERTRFVFAAGAVAAILMVTAGFTVIPAYGVMAAAAARVAIQTAVAMATVWYVGRHLQSPPPYGSLARLLLAALICAGVAFGCIRVVPGPAGLAVAIVLAALVYVAAVRLLGALPAEDVDKLARAAGVLPAPLANPAAATLRLLAR